MSPENLHTEYYICPPRTAVMAPRPRRTRIRAAYNTRSQDYQIVPIAAAGLIRRFKLEMNVPACPGAQSRNPSRLLKSPRVCVILPAPACGPGVHVAMIGDLAHHAIDDEFARTILGSRDQRQRFDHEGAFLRGRVGTMLA